MSMDRRTLLKGLAVAGAGAVAPVEASEQYAEAPADAVGMLYDATRCIGCRTCVTVCPFGAMSFNHIDKKVIKCDLCDGDPQCARFCEVNAIEYVEACDVAIDKKRTAADRLHKAAAKAAAEAFFEPVGSASPAGSSAQLPPADRRNG
mgnify:CR=1 FL=1